MSPACREKETIDFRQVGEWQAYKIKETKSKPFS